MGGRYERLVVGVIYDSDSPVERLPGVRIEIIPDRHGFVYSIIERHHKRVKTFVTELEVSFRLR